MALTRVLETEVMDTVQEAMDYDSMDHSEANRSFVDDLFAIGGGSGDILDIGTGTAQIPIELSNRQTQCRIMAADLSVNMLEVARLNIEIAGLIEQIQLAQMDAKQLPSPDEYFDAVICNGMLHHIPEVSNVLAEAVRVAKPGGLLFFRDLLRPASEDELRQLVDAYAGGANEHQQQMFEDSLRAGLTLDEMSACVSQLGFAPDTVQATSDRHWTWTATK
jgi:ubiquinone/menaquinone biosynthesis C-methylase UbiE